MKKEMAAVRAEGGEPDRCEPDMDERVHKMIELNALREQCSDQLFQDNPGSVNCFVVTMDSNTNQPAIQIGLDPSAKQDELVLPAELAGATQLQPW
eukprot:Skav233767  [mRNA]  locus=scaffold780:11673:14072:- [translate_table: standard]